MDLGLLYTALIGYALAATAFGVLFGRRSSTARIFGIDDLAFWGTVGSGLLGIFKKKKQNDAEKAARAAYNQWLKDRSQTANDIIKNLADRGIDVYGPQVSTQTGTQSGTSSESSRSTTTSSQEGETSSMPVITEEYRPMEGKLRALIEGRLGQSTAVSEAEKAANLERINRSMEPMLANIRNRMSRMNLGGTSLQAAMLANPVETERAAQTTAYLGSLPAEEPRRRNEDLAIASGAIGAFGKGEHGTSRMSGTSTTTGSRTGTTSGTSSSTSTRPPDYLSLFGMLAPPNPNASMQTGQSSLLSGGTDLLGSLLQLYANRNKNDVMTLPTTVDRSSWGLPNP